MVRVALVSAMLAASGCGECAMSCPHEALQAMVDVTAAQLSSGTVTFCVNGRCHAGALPQVDAPGDTDATLDGCTLVKLFPEVSGGFDMTLAPCDVTTIAAGDELALTIADSMGRTIVSRSLTVGYTDKEVCGQTCHVLQLEL